MKFVHSFPKCTHRYFTGAAYRTNLSVALLRLSEKGELLKIKNKWWTNKKKKCDNLYEKDGDELSIFELGGAFLVVGTGALIAIFLGICEFLWNIQQVAMEQRVRLYFTNDKEFIKIILFKL